MASAAVRPRVTLKLATSLDGRIATASGESRWITGEAAREQVHRLRAAHQAVMVGVETVVADDPELTVRLEGFDGPQPARVVLDSRQRLPLASRLVTGARRLPTIVVSTAPPRPELVEAGVAILTVAAQAGRVEPAAALAALCRHITDAAVEAVAGLSPPLDGAAWTPRVMIEGGGQVAASFIAAGLVDAIEWFRAPIVLGDAGRPAVGGFVLDRLSEAPRFRRLAVEACGDDLWERYERL